jgi:hypothetical protein
VKGARPFAWFWWDLLVGDDWQIAAGIASALTLTVLLAAHHINAWWLIPIAITLLLVRSLHRATRSSSRQ